MSRVLLIMKPTLFVVLYFLSFTVYAQTISNYDTCRTSLYLQNIGNGNTRLQVSKARTVKDHGLLTAGSINAGANQQAWLMKQGMDGRVLWQQEYGNAGFDEEFTDWRELSDGKLILAGTAKHTGTQQSLMQVSLASAAGNIIWQRSYADMGVGNISNVKVIPDQRGNWFFAAEGEGFLFYGLLNPANGNFVWQRSISTEPGTRLVGVISNYLDMIIATNSTQSAFKVANFYYVKHWSAGNPTTIAETLQLGGPSQNAHYILHDYEPYDVYNFFSGIRSVNNGSWELLRVNMKFGFIKEALETIQTPGIILDSNSRTATNLYGDVLSFTTGRKSKTIHAVKLADDISYHTVIPWAASFTFADSLTIAGNAKIWDAGYHFMGIKEFPGNKSQLVQLKTDSAANAPICVHKQTRAFSVSSNTFPTNTVSFAYNTAHILGDFSYSTSASGIAADTLFLCRETKCPVVPVTDSCLNSFDKVYESYNPGSYANSIQIINNRIFVGGQSRAMFYETSQQNSFVAEINSNGQVIKQRNFVVGIGSSAKLFKTSDKHLMLYGNTTDSTLYGSVFFAKLDSNLNLKWIKTLNLTNIPTIEMNVGDVTESSDGGYFINYSWGESFGERRQYLTKISSNGDFVWSKVYRVTDPGFYNEMIGSNSLVYNGHIYMVCNNSYNSHSSTSIVKINEVSGAVVWCKRYNNALDYLRLDRYLNVYGNQLYLSGNSYVNNPGSPDPIIVKLDTDGNVQQSALFETGIKNTHLGLVLQQQAGGDISFTGFGFGGNRMHLNGKLNSNLQILSSRKRLRPDFTWSTAAALSNDGYLYEAGGYQADYNFWGNLYINKFDQKGNLGICGSDTMLFNVVNNFPIQVTNVTVPVSDSNFILRIPVHRSEQYFIATSAMRCASVPGCNFLKINGDTLICNRTSSYNYISVRNTGCAAPVEWTYDPAKVQLMYRTDSSIRFRFLAPGNVLLKAKIVSGCVAYADSILITVVSEAPALNIGPADTTLCPNATLLLNARKGFKSYLWQNGSTDSTFSVTAAGLYHVTVTDSCNNVLNDSIQVHQSGSGIVLNLGNDTSFCSSNSILLQAQAGFASYAWQSGATSQQITASTPGLYWVRVTDACGNIFSDSLRIAQYRLASTLNIGRDTTACGALSLLLDAGGGFKTYLWQGGSNGSSFTVTAAGLYHVTVSDSCNNVFSDTIQVYQDGNGIVLDLGNDTSFCSSNSIVLQAQAGFASYTWQNGVTSRQLTASTPGLYWVSVKDACGNIFTDSLLIARYRRASTLNLGRDTTACGTFSVLLDAGSGFKTYRWQNGSTMQQFPANTSGSYYVEVMDSCGTIAKDTLQVLADTVFPFDIGSNSSICRNDSLALRATSGLSNYNWWPTNNAMLKSPQQLTVFPASTTWYYASAVKPNGCLVKDSALISINALPTVNIGPDKSICFGDSLQLKGGSGFRSYLWSNGAQTTTIYVKQIGLYTLRITDANGCAARDSMHINTIIPLPDAGLPSTLGVCKGQTSALSAEAGLSSYLWSTGAINQVININSTGIYWVSVANAAGCSSTDTVFVNSQYSVPANFLPFSDTAICSYETVEIAAPATYRSYLWSNGNTTSRNILQPKGLHWLSVTDLNGCIGKDSVSIRAKDCPVRIYFPNSFTPNNDGSNDFFKPGIFGLTSQYRLVIYNRYGQPIFETNNPSNGWDGTFKAEHQPMGAYVWVCQYQLVGSTPTMAKGYVLMLR